MAGGVARAVQHVEMNGANVDADNLALDQFPVAGNPVNDFIVDRDADIGRESLVSQEGRSRVVLAKVVGREFVKRPGGDTGSYVFRDQIEDLGDDPPRVSHLFNFAGRFQLDHFGSATAWEMALNTSSNPRPPSTSTKTPLER